MLHLSSVFCSQVHANSFTVPDARNESWEKWLSALGSTWSGADLASLTHIIVLVRKIKEVLKPQGRLVGGKCVQQQRLQNTHTHSVFSQGSTHQKKLFRGKASTPGVIGSGFSCRRGNLFPLTQGSCDRLSPVCIPSKGLGRRHPSTPVRAASSRRHEISKNYFTIWKLCCECLKQRHLGPFSWTRISCEKRPVFCVLYYSITHTGFDTVSFSL